MNNLSIYITVYLDRAFTAASLEVPMIDEEQTFDEWFAEGYGDIERVQRTIDITNMLIKALEANPTRGALLGDIAVTDFCYNVLEYEVKDELLEFANAQVKTPSNKYIVEFIITHLEQMHTALDAELEQERERRRG